MDTEQVAFVRSLSEIWFTRALLVSGGVIIVMSLIAWFVDDKE